VTLTFIQILLGTPTLLARYWQFCLPAVSILITFFLGDYSFIAFLISPPRNSDSRHDGKFSTIPQAKMNVSCE